MTTIDTAFAMQEKLLAARGYRQQLLASNIANADTPNYKAMDIDFSRVFQSARGMQSDVGMSKTSPLHLDAKGGSGVAGMKPMYRTAVQPSIDGNTVDSNVEQAQFAENSLQYMATLQFINERIKGVKLALQGAS